MLAGTGLTPGTHSIYTRSVTWNSHPLEWRHVILPGLLLSQWPLEPLRILKHLKPSPTRGFCTCCLLSLEYSSAGSLRASFLQASAQLSLLRRLPEVGRWNGSSHPSPISLYTLTLFTRLHCTHHCPTYYVPTIFCWLPRLYIYFQILI